ncbi:MAG: HIT family protein [Candidatus Pacebacteria bacterium]|nr:HIT family protein [Candidatus Paceibacterota bacterium]
MGMNDCLFCKIITGEIPCEKIYENETTLAFLDIKPVNPGHTLVIPKSHYVNTLEAPEEVMLEVMKTVKKVAHGIEKGLGVSDFNLAMNNGATAGQVIFHAHMHVIPRHEGDGQKLWHGTPYNEGEMQKIALKLKNAL